MILGKIKDGEDRIRTTEDIACTVCSKKVPGGITVSDKIFGTKMHQKMLKEFKESYMCGICRSKSHSRL